MKQQNPQEKKEYIPTKEKVAIISSCVLVALSIAVWGYICVNGIRPFPYIALVFCSYAFTIGGGIIWITVLFSEYFKRAVFYAALFGVFISAAWFYVTVGVRDNITTQAFDQFFNAFMAICVFLISVGVIFKTYLESLKRAHKPITDDVDYESNKRALAAIVGVAILIIVSSAISYLFFPKGGEIFDESITFTKIVLFSAGITTFYWAAKANFIKAEDLTERKLEAKRHVEHDTAQLISDAAKLLGGQSDAEKYAGLAFLNKVASKEDTPFSKQAFDMIYHYVLYEKDQTTANKTRIAALKYLEVLIDKYETWDKEIIILETSPDDRFLQNTFNLLICYKNFTIVRMNFENTYDFSQFENCFFDGCIIKGIFPINCSFWGCIIESVYSHVTGVGYWTKYREYEENILEFEQSDLSGFHYHGSFTKIKVDGCYYNADNPPDEYFLEIHKDNLTAKDPQ